MCCGWLSFSRVLYQEQREARFHDVAVGFHFPECYTGSSLRVTSRLLRLAFIFQSAIPAYPTWLSVSGCGWLSFSRVLYFVQNMAIANCVAVGFHFPECYTPSEPCPRPQRLRLAFIFQSAILSASAWTQPPSCGWLSFSRVLYHLVILM